MKINVLFILVLCVVAVLPVSGQTVAYSHNDAPLFTVRMPDGWKFESQPNPRNPAAKRISGTASKGLVWFGVWVVKDAKTIEEAVNVVRTTTKALIPDVKESKAAHLGDANGMRARYSEHTGTMKMQDGKLQAFDAQVVLFDVGGGRIGIAVCVYDADGMKAEKANIDGFFKSIKPIK
jgi:hypothetical protein